MKNWLVGLAVVLTACSAHERAAAACVPQLEIALADGSRVCLSDHPLGELRPSRQWSALKVLVAHSYLYTLAMPGNAAACPGVAGFAIGTGKGGAAADFPEHRAALALSDCNAAVRAAGSSADCACALVAVDGRSPLGAREFAERARGSLSVAAAQAPRVVVAPDLRAASAAAAGAASPEAIAPAAAAGPSTADFAALRQQIESLQTQVSRQGAAAAQPPVAARPAAPKLRARALVVGNGAYASLGVLGNPRNDAEAIAERLRKFGVEVDLVLDAGRTALVKALTDYQSRATGYDVNILFYAGHGLQVGGINYLVPVDLPAENATMGSVKFNALSLNDVLEYLSAPTRVVFLDACRDNPLSRSLLASRSTAGVGLAPVNATSGTLVAYATKDGSTAEDGRGRHSPYTSALLQHLDADEDVAIVLRRVRQAVLKATNSRQEPWEYGSLIGDQLVLSRLGR